ncbi:MAG: hypothetical protein ACKO7W_06620 [Elainella sp.]
MPLAIPALILAFIGLLISSVAGVWTLILAFQDHWGWGLAYLFVPFASLVFIIMKWSKRAVRRSFFLGLGGTLLMFLGVGLAAPSLTEMAQTEMSYDLPSEPDAEVSLAPQSSPESSPESSMAETVAVSSGAASNNAPELKSAPAAGNYDYKQSMSLGYLAFKKQDYQTALINFQRALAARPGDRLASDAIQNTQKAIQQGRS